MKRTITFLLALIMALSLVACGGSQSTTSEATVTQTTPEPSKEVTLTKENIEQYLVFDFDYSDVERDSVMGLSLGYTDLTTNVYSTQSGSFNNVKITMNIELDYGWSVKKGDKASSRSDKGFLTLDFRLPSNGSFTEKHELSASGAWSNPRSRVKYTITSVSGTFVPA